VPHPLRRCWANTCVGGCRGGCVIALFSTVEVTDVTARAGIVSASGSTIVAVSTITGVGSRGRGLVSTQPMILGFVRATEMEARG
jgi:hypothetical protein